MLSSIKNLIGFIKPEQSENANSPLTEVVNPPEWNHDKVSKLLAVYGVRHFLVGADGVLMVNCANSVIPVYVDGNPINVLAADFPDIKIADHGE